MKDLYLIGGAMGIGKTAVGQQLKRDLLNSVFLDEDWCWDADPFLVTEETKAMVLENICCLLNNFLRCTACDHVIFCWVMHQQEIIDAILSRLNAENCRVHCLSLWSAGPMYWRNGCREISRRASVRRISSKKAYPICRFMGRCTRKRSIRQSFRCSRQRI